MPPPPPPLLGELSLVERERTEEGIEYTSERVFNKRTRRPSMCVFCDYCCESNQQTCALSLGLFMFYIYSVSTHHLASMLLILCDTMIWFGLSNNLCLKIATLEHLSTTLQICNAKFAIV